MKKLILPLVLLFGFTGVSSSLRAQADLVVVNNSPCDMVVSVSFYNGSSQLCDAFDVCLFSATILSGMTYVVPNPNVIGAADAQPYRVEVTNMSASPSPTIIIDPYSITGDPSGVTCSVASGGGILPPCVAGAPMIMAIFTPRSGGTNALLNIF